MDPTAQARTVAKRYATAWAADDLHGILGCYADVFTLHYFGDHPFAGDHVGKDAAIAVLLESGGRAPRHLIAVDEVLAGHGTAVLVVREKLSLDGRVEEIRRVLRFRVVGDQFSECWLYEESQELVNRAWSDPSD